MNSVNYKTGKKFHQSAEDLKREKEFSNRLCREDGLSEAEARSDWKEMPKWKSKLRSDAYYAAKVAEVNGKLRIKIQMKAKFSSHIDFIPDDDTLCIRVWDLAC